MVTSPKDFFSIRPHKVGYLESICNFRCLPLKSPGGTRTGKRPSANQQEGQLGVEVKLNDYSLEFSLAPGDHVSALKVCHRSKGYHFVSAPNQHGLCDFLKDNWLEK